LADSDDADVQSINIGVRTQPERRQIDPCCPWRWIVKMRLSVTSAIGRLRKTFTYLRFTGGMTAKKNGDLYSPTCGSKEKQKTYTHINTMKYNKQEKSKKTNTLEMWANAQRDGRPAQYRWRPLFNVARFG